MTYNGTYGSGDVDDITIDVVGTAGVEVLQYISLIILVILFGWLMTKIKKF